MMKAAVPKKDKNFSLEGSANCVDIKLNIVTDVCLDFAARMQKWPMPSIIGVMR